MRSLPQFVLFRFRSRRSGLTARFSRLRDESGSALVELAVTLSLVGVPLLLLTVHFSVLLLNSIVITNAAHAGAEYAMTSSTFAEDTSNIRAAAQADAAGLGTSLTVTPSIFYACSAAISGTQYTTQAAATAACTGGTNHALEFVQVVASANVTPPTSVPGFPNTVTLSGTSIMEVEE